MIWFILILGMSANAAVIEGQERGGGKQVELEFAEMGRLASGALANSLKEGESLFEGFKLGHFNLALSATEIWAKPDLCETRIDLTTGGAIRRCLDARYLPEMNRIEVSEKDWRPKTCLEKAALAVHEFGRASGNEDGNYFYSSRVKSSQAFWDACDLFEREQSRRCEKKLPALKVSLGRAAEEFRQEKSGRKALDMYVVTIENIMEKWGKVNGGQCSESAEAACLESCTDIAGISCVDVCQLGNSSR